MSVLTRDGTGRPNLTRETKLSGANGDRENSVSPVQLTTSRTGDHTRLMPSLLKVMTTHIHISELSTPALIVLSADSPLLLHTVIVTSFTVFGRIEDEVREQRLPRRLVERPPRFVSPFKR